MATEALERREAAERRVREDYEARQVVVWVEVPAEGHDFRRITVSTPHAYPIKQVEGRLVCAGNGGLSITPFGRAGDAPYVDDQRIYYGFLAEIPLLSPDAVPIIRFTDWHGNRYYQYRHYTDRFSQNDEFLVAALKLDEWTRLGPKPD